MHSAMMMSNLVTKILYQKRKFIIGWSIGLFALSVLMLLFFPTLKDSDLGRTFNSMSPALQKVIGGASSFNSLDGYISNELFGLRMPLLMIVLSIMLFASLTVGDERRGLLASQLSLPLSRTRLLSQKLLAAVLILIIVSLGAILGIVVGLMMIHETYSLIEITRHTLGCLLIALDFGLVVFVCGGGFGLKGAATGIASGVAFLAYLFSSLVAVVSWIQPIEKLSLFHYYQNPTPVSLPHAGLLVGLAVVGIVIGLAAFTRRDVE